MADKLKSVSFSDFVDHSQEKFLKKQELLKDGGEHIDEPIKSNTASPADTSLADLCSDETKE